VINVRAYTLLDDEAFAHAPRLRMVSILGTGTDNVDLASARRRGITVTNTPGVGAPSVAELTIGLIVALARAIPLSDARLRQGVWQHVEGPELAGKTLGVLGLGAIGQYVARLGRAFGMRVLFSAYKGVDGMGPLYTPFDDVMRTSDVITLHSPLMPSTKNMISEREFALMERRPLLINTARGGLVDEQALVTALDKGQIGGAGFDVVIQEPPPPDHPLMRIAARPNVILTPHIAWASQEAIQSLADQLIDNVEAFWSGRPRNVVAP
jgi:glycerate dehydrogenase